MKTIFVFLLLALSARFRLSKSAAVVEKLADEWPLAIIHINDFHARFEETNAQANSCKEGEECIGGYARIVTKVKELLKKHETDNHPIYLNAGDSFQGTLWYNVLRWKVTAHFLNLLPADVMTLGNHEFDHGIEGVVPFIEQISTVTPIVAANIDASGEPDMDGTFLKSYVIDKYDRKIGVIGVVLQTYDQLASMGNLKFLDEIETVRAEADKLHAQDVDIIIVLSHSGLDVDEKIAEHAGPYVDIIVGGHSHTFLYEGDNPPGPDRPQGPYPVTVTQEGGHKVYILQASAYAKYVGEFVAYFDENGDVTRFGGGPHFLGPNVIPDPEIVEELKPWKEIVDSYGKRVVGETMTLLDRGPCSRSECTMGNLVTDAFRYSIVLNNTKTNWTDAEIVLQNVGGMRTSLAAGNLTYGDLVTVLPFENLLKIFELRGDKLLLALEYSVAESGGSQRNMLHYSGMKVEFDMTQPVGERVRSVKIVCRECEVPKLEPIDPLKYYKIVCPSFLADGGDGFTWFRDYGINKQLGYRDIDIFEAYIQKISPFFQHFEDRITVKS